MKKTIVLFCGIAAAGFAGPETLTLEQALELARQNSPELRAARAEALAARQDVRAAGRWSNPELAFDAEGAGGDNNGFDRAEYTLGIAQEFPISGKTGNDREAARHAQQAATYATAHASLEFETTVRSAFIQVLAWQETVAVRNRQETLAQEFLAAVDTRHAAGGASELDRIQAEVQLEKVRLENQVAEKHLATARSTLAARLGVAASDMESLSGDLYEPMEMPEVAVRDSLPSLQRFQALESQARAEGRRAMSMGIPDLTLGAGAKYEADGDIQTYTFGASIPLPVFGTGRAESAAAGFRADALNAEHEKARRELQQELTEAAAEYETASAEALRYKQILIPMAEKAYGLGRDGYEAGRYSALELISVQQNLVESNLRYIEALRSARLAQTQLIKFTSGE